MRHGRHVNQLSRTHAHRDALMMNLAQALIERKRITTTVAKAKELRRYIEPLITRAKSDTTHDRRIVFSYLNSKEAVQELFGDIAEKIQDRPGGYTRILRTANRAGDNADMCFIELVDYNTTFTKEYKGKAAGEKKKRTRRGSSSAAAKKAEGTEATETQATTKEKPAPKKKAAPKKDDL